MSLIKISNLTFGYDGSLNNIFENVSFNIDTDWKLGLIGRNGKGKTTFLNLLQEKYKYEGTITATITKKEAEDELSYIIDNATLDNASNSSKKVKIDKTTNTITITVTDPEITGGYDDNITIHHHAAKGYIFIFIDNPGNDIRSAGTSIIAENNADTKSQQAGPYYTSHDFLSRS